MTPPPPKLRGKTCTPTLQPPKFSHSEKRTEQDNKITQVKKYQQGKSMINKNLEDTITPQGMFAGHTEQRTGQKNSNLSRMYHITRYWYPLPGNKQSKQQEQTTISNTSIHQCRISLYLREHKRDRLQTIRRLKYPLKKLDKELSMEASKQPRAIITKVLS